MKSNLKDETPVTISASKGKESTMALINSLAVQGEDLAMKRRRYNELRRQNEIRRKKGILFGRDIDGGEGERAAEPLDEPPRALSCSASTWSMSAS